MSFNAAALQMMLNKGLTLSDVVEIAAANEVRRDPTAAERMARYRENKKAEAATRNVTRNGSDAAPPTALDKETPPTPPKEINPTTPRVCGSRARAWHRLPEDWQPRPLPAPVQAKVDLWPPGAVADEFAAFRRWAANAEDKNGKGRKLDWDQAWRNWIGRRHDERYSKLQCGTVASLRGSRPDPALDLLRAAERAEEAERSYSQDHRGIGTPLPAIGRG